MRPTPLRLPTANGVYYRTKRVRPVFVDEPSEIVVVSVYTYFF